MATEQILHMRLSFKLIVTSLILLPALIVGQGPAPVGISIEQVQTANRFQMERSRLRYRATPTGKGAIVGAAIGATFGYIATTRSLGGSDGDGIGRAPAMISMAILGGLIGAFVGHIVNDHPRDASEVPQYQGK